MKNNHPSILFAKKTIATATLFFTIIMATAQKEDDANTSYKANTLPIGGMKSTAFGYGALKANSGTGNIANGFNSLFSNTSGSYNTANGYFTLLANKIGNNNTATGANALMNNTIGSLNTANGYSALMNNTSGVFNTANGADALRSNTTGSDNTAAGASALWANTIGFWNTANGAQALTRNTTGYGNTANGWHALRANINGGENTANGVNALLSNTSGFGNVANGVGALFSNSVGNENTATGRFALSSNTSGINNTANGSYALYSNTTGYLNTASGHGALMYNTIGNVNTASGYQALYGNSTGNYNIASGFNALWHNFTGSYNTALGTFSDVSTGNLTNATALGNGAIVNNSNKIRLGDANVTIVESAAGSWTVSDGRFKSDIKEEVKGLEFIKLLRPVVYNFDVNKFDEFLTQSYPDSIKASRKEMMNKSTSKLPGIHQSGFIAQEMEMAAKNIGYSFNGVHAPENPTDNYSISYEKLVVPLVKAVQELSNENEALKARLDKIEQMLTTKTTSIENLSNARIEQNVPNPYNGSTIINYYVPSNAGSAVLKVTDIKGFLLKTFTLNKGNGKVVLQADQLSSGTYQYSLLVNNQIIDTKQMILIR